MKKICLLILCVLLTANVANSANYCTQAGGAIVSSVPKPSSVGGTMTLCKSGHSMNFWSAVAWCEAVGGRIINYDDMELTGSASGPTVVNLNGYIDGTIWTGYRYSASAVFRFSSSRLHSYDPYGAHYTLCVMDD